MFGIFFSRYWAYSASGLIELVKEYEVHQVPLDVFVTDMDWHETFYKEAAEGIFLVFFFIFFQKLILFFDQIILRNFECIFFLGIL